MDGEDLRGGADGHRGQGGEPFAIGAGGGGDGLAGEGDGDGFAGVGPAPEGDFGIGLDNHVVGDDGWEADVGEAG